MEGKMLTSLSLKYYLVKCTQFAAEIVIEIMLL